MQQTLMWDWNTQYQLSTAEDKRGHRSPASTETEKKSNVHKF